jgi:CRISPR/Cas system CMR subunit Cmr4 (Cas7 group RAMP superfamily)
MVFYSNIKKIIEKKYGSNKQNEILNEIKDGKPKNFFRENLGLLIIGGHETIGSGLVKINFFPEEQQTG